MAVADADGAIGVGDEAIPAACGPINFFATEEAGRAFTERVQGTFLLTIEEGHKLGRLINRAVYGSTLGQVAADIRRRTVSGSVCGTRGAPGQSLAPEDFSLVS